MRHILLVYYHVFSISSMLTGAADHMYYERVIWKIAFWAYLFIVVVGAVSMVSSIFRWSIADGRGMLEGILLVLGVFELGFRRKVFAPKIWNVVFVYLIIAWTLDLFYIFFLRNKLGIVNSIFETTGSPTTSSNVELAVLFGLPGLYAIYQLTSTSRKKK